MWIWALATFLPQPSPPCVKPSELSPKAVRGWSSDYWALPQTASSSHTGSGSLSSKWNKLTLILVLSFYLCLTPLSSDLWYCVCKCPLISKHLTVPAHLMALWLVHWLRWLESDLCICGQINTQYHQDYGRRVDSWGHFFENILITHLFWLERSNVVWLAKQVTTCFTSKKNLLKK